MRGGAAPLGDVAAAGVVRRDGELGVAAEQIDELGLQPWRVAKVYALWEKQGSQVVVDNSGARPLLDTSSTCRGKLPSQRISVWRS